MTKGTGVSWPVLAALGPPSVPNVVLLSSLHSVSLWPRLASSLLLFWPFWRPLLVLVAALERRAPETRALLLVAPFCCLVLVFSSGAHSSSIAPPAPCRLAGGS